MTHQPRLLAIFAHPDDESLGTGATLAKYAAEGVEVSLVTATRGERGWLGDERDNPGLRALGAIRETELRAAADALGITDLSLLDYVDGELDQADPGEVIARLVAHVRRVCPQVVVTFGPDGVYGHPDHVVISQLATTAVVCAADPGFEDAERRRPHRVAKLYYRVWTAAEMAAYQAAFGDIVMTIEGVERRPVGWHDWAITTRVDTERYWRTAWDAIACHRSQLPLYGLLRELPPERHRDLWGSQGFYRALSGVHGGRGQESDLFQGLRAADAVAARRYADCTGAREAA